MLYQRCTQQQMQYESLRGDFSVCQNYNITPWKQIKQHKLGCWDHFISNAVFSHKECFALDLSMNIKDGLSVFMVHNLLFAYEINKTL